MPRKIYKYELFLTEQQTVNMPVDSFPLCVQLQNNTICLWASVIPTNEYKNYTVYIVGTGHEYDPAGKEYLGTVQQGNFVWHVFIGVD